MKKVAFIILFTIVHAGVCMGLELSRFLSSFSRMHSAIESTFSEEVMKSLFDFLVWPMTYYIYHRPKIANPIAVVVLNSALWAFFILGVYLVHKKYRERQRGVNA